MKKHLFIATALVALASCSSNDFVGEDTSSTTNQNEQAAISFSSGLNSITRADHVGADAADLLGNKFYVAGFKNNGTSYTTVFDHYSLEWEANTAGTTTDNTSDWKYVGSEALGLAGHITTGLQTIKYWDYAASYYDFVAFSAGKGNTIIASGDPSSTKILATAVVPTTLTTAAYTLKGSADDLANCYIADLVTAKKSGATSPDINYQDEVSVTFRRLGAKVRVALYETIPGYSVRDVKFYQDPSTTTIETGASETKATLFTSTTVFYPSGTMTIKFPTIGTTNRDETDYNKAHVSFAGTGTATSKQEFGTLNYEATKANWEDSRLDYEGNNNTYLKRTSSAPSFAGTDPYYLTVLPDESGNVLELRVDYTLESVDGSKEEIVVHGATAFVPQIYAQWKPNYAYTYIFKISDGTNGWTSKVSTDPKGLYPITFDAIVVDSEEHTQSTITTVSSPSITTYQKGHDITKDEYGASTTDSIYIQVMDGTTLVSDLNTKGALYTVTGTNVAKVTEADVMDALNIRTSGEATTIVGRNGFTLTPLATAQLSTGNTPTTFGNIPGADGNPIPNIAANTAVRFPATAGTYAYVYYTGTDADDTDYHSAVILNAQPTGWPTGYYTDEACTVAATTYADGTYYQKYTNLNKVYAVKVIRVQ